MGLDAPWDQVFPIYSSPKGVCVLLTFLAATSGITRGCHEASAVLGKKQTRAFPQKLSPMRVWDLCGFLIILLNPTTAGELRLQS